MTPTKKKAIEAENRGDITMASNYRKMAFKNQNK